jgi:hypothetical protein
VKPVSDLHAAARRFASNGVPVFPCLPGLKVPATEHGFHDATTDLAQIDAWWTDEPRLNVAFCPHMAGLAVIDPDGEEGLTNWANWQIEHGYLPDTYTVRTPRGGVHLYFRGSLPPSQSKLAPHVDTRGVGSYALLPPSYFAEVDGYYTVEDERAPAELPPHVGAYLERLKKDAVKAAPDTDLDQPQNVARARKLLLDYVERGNVAVEGQMGDNKTFVTACEVVNLGLTAETAFELMADLWNPHCVPPWDEDELEIKVENAARYSQNEAGAWATGSTQDVFGSALDKLAPTASDPSPELKRRRFKPISLAELRTRPPPECLLPDLLPKGGLSMLYGPPGSYKSFLAIDWVGQLGAAKRRTLYVAGEGGNDMAPRFDAWALAHGVEGELSVEVVEDAPWINDPSMMTEFIEEARAFKPDLIVIDTFARASVGMNENDARDMGLFVAGMDAIRKATGAAVLVIHHSGKDENRGARGSGALFAATDAAYEARADKAAKALAVHHRRMKAGPEREAPWTYEVRQVGQSATLQGITLADYSALTKVQDQLSGRAVGSLLRALGAAGIENGISSHVLALELVQRNADPDLSEEAKETMISRQTRVLGKLAKGPLEAYAAGSGPDLVWFVP